MTQRRRLDAYLAEQAAAAGADFRDGAKVTAVGRDVGGGFTVDGRHASGCSRGADRRRRRERRLGSARSASAHEPDLRRRARGQPGRTTQSARSATAGRRSSSSAPFPGGYGWVFPKGDHANFGVGGWEREGPALREHLRTLCHAHGVSAGGARAACGATGCRCAGPRRRLARGRALLVGDAAGLVDPLSGRRHVRGVRLRAARRRGRPGRPRRAGRRPRAVRRAPCAGARAPHRRLVGREARVRSLPAPRVRAVAADASSGRWSKALLCGDLGSSRRGGRRARARAAEGRRGPRQARSGSPGCRYRARGRRSLRRLRCRTYLLSALDDGERVVTRAARRRPLGRHRPLDRQPARATRTTRGRASSHFLEHLLFKGTQLLLGAGHRGDLRRDRRGAERGDDPRVHGRLRPRHGRAHRDGARRDDRHGVRPDLRGSRLGARGRARGDRDVRGRPAGARPRPDHPGDLRRLIRSAGR